MPDPAPRRLHMVCNAHLDPVWLWTWEDGLAEAITTFRTAADFCEQYDTLVFNHNEALLYHWVQRHDPPLFARIQKLVRQGRWHIAGGAWLQPDVNGPCAESHIRQYLLGLDFFRKHFKSRPTVAYNFDPFGHPAGFPQLLRGCGMDGYIFCRPDVGTFDLPRGWFRWIDRDGSEVMARRSDDHYLTQGAGYHHMDAKFDHWLRTHFKDESPTMILWGIGNHGGGPSHRDLQRIYDKLEEYPELEMHHSTPEAFLDDALRSNDFADWPTHELEIQHSFPGCYTSLSRVKRAHRKAEAMVQSVERFAALAWWFTGTRPDHAALTHAWREVLFAEFHDILPGTCIERAEQDALDALHGLHDELRRVAIRVALPLMQSQAKAEPDTTPVFIFNPSAHRFDRTVEFEFCTGYEFNPNNRITVTRDGREQAWQQVRQGHNLIEQPMVRLAVPMTLEPFQLARLDVHAERREKPSKLRRTTNALKRPSARDLTFQGDQGTFVINPRTGLIDAIKLKNQPTSLVKKNAFQPALFDDLDHSWTCGDPEQIQGTRTTPEATGWTRPSDTFQLATAEQVAALSPLPRDKWDPLPRGQTAAQPIRVTDNGPVRTVVEAVFVCDASAIVRHYVFDKPTGTLEIRDRIYFNHKDRFLKLMVPADGTPTRTVSESLYSTAERTPTRRHEDHPHQRWTALEVEQGGTPRWLTVTTDSSFAHSLTRKDWGLSVLRSPAHSSMIMQPDQPWAATNFTPRHDQGMHTVSFRVAPMDTLDEPELARRAEQHHLQPMSWSFFPGNQGERCDPLCDGTAIDIKPANVHVSAVKPSQVGQKLVVRLVERRGRKSAATLTLGDHEIGPIDVPAHGVETVVIERRAGHVYWQHTNCVEGL